MIAVVMTADELAERHRARAAALARELSDALLRIAALELLVAELDASRDPLLCEVARLKRALGEVTDAR